MTTATTRRPERFTVTVTTATGARWVGTFNTASGAAADLFEHLAAVEGAAFSITTQQPHNRKEGQPS